MSVLEKLLSPKVKINRFLQENLPVFGLWLFFRVFTSAIAAVSSSIKPITEIERRVALWPPSSPIIEWLERVFISPWNRWDVVWYTRILTNGYSKADGTANFHPLFPWLGKLLSSFRISPELSLIIISAVSSLVYLIVFKEVFASTSDRNRNMLWLLVILVFPTSFVLFAPYSESLFLLFSILCVYFLRIRKWGLAGISGFLAVLTRQQGLFLIFPYVWELWNAYGKKNFLIRSMWQKWNTVLYIPLAYVIWIGYRILVVGEITKQTGTLQGIIYTIFISPNAKKVVPNQRFIWPWDTLVHVFNKIAVSPDLDIWINITLAFVFILMIIFSWKNMTSSLRLYSIIIYVVSFSYFTGDMHPLMGLPRHLSLAFPVLSGIMPLITKTKPILWSYLVFSIFFMAFLITAYTTMAWIP